MEPYHLALPSGYRIDTYEIQTVLGKGGFGITYAAYDWANEQHMAIKELLPDTIATRADGATVVPMGPSHEESWEWARERFMEEARSLASFRHPNIIEVHQLIEANGTVYLVMDFIEGASFEAHLAQIGRVSDQASLMKVLGPILSGVHAIHQVGLLHRDIKPENILLHGDGSPVLIDFGSAREQVGKTVTMTSIVTHGYSPIEQYQTRGRMGPWTDIYALAAMVCRAITGEKPPVASDRVLDDDFPGISKMAPPGFDAHFLSAVDWALHVRPEERPQTLEDWLSAGIAPLKTLQASQIPPVPKESDWLLRLREKAGAGEALSQFTLALLLDTGDQVERDPAEAFKWYSMAARQGHAKAQNNLACMYASGDGVQRSFSEALCWYRQAADAGNATARRNLAEMILKGKGTPRDTAQAISLYEAAAEDGDPEARHCLAMIFFKGDGVKPNSRTAFRWFYAASNMGYAKSQYYLGLCYLEGRGAEKNFQRAMTWMEESAGQGDTNALHNLGWMYHNGVGVSKDPAKAKSLYDKAAAARLAGLRGMSAKR